MAVIIAGVVTFVGSTIVFILTYHLLSSKDEGILPGEKVIPTVYKMRFVYFVSLVVVLVGVLTFTLRSLPYFHADETPDVTVKVEARMWSWLMKTPGSEGPQINLPANKVIEFQVTGVDINHGFGIYNDQGQIVAQVQAMPGYTNILHHKFEKQGDYLVLCMEYCGLLHHQMIGKLIVR